MVQILHCKTKSALSSPTFDNLTDDVISKTIDVDMYTIGNTKDLFIKLYELLNTNDSDKTMFDVNNIWYDYNHVIQSITCDDIANEIYIKRCITDNDSYTFMEYDVIIIQMIIHMLI